ncbi:MAG: DNA topoisomerase 3 [Prevotella sp.]|nr:DNA topoisomerase 3 [Bacteroides sp.]MCM1365840.1 DNA topoisomerase 3 [Prevotella sp.]MCM1436468.1 DNA topoisomerase 3 [Prevotella sp.]
MILCITEKPSVAKDIAKIIGANVSCSGYFEGNGYCVTWTFGHLCTLKEPHDYTPVWKSWAMSTLPMIPQRFGIKLIQDKGIEKQFNVIKNLISQADEVINCGDAGQEGELIQRWVMQKAECKIPVKRLWISSLTDEAIREGFEKLRPHKDLEPLYLAGLCRAIGDWMLGINATRLYSLKYGEHRQILSIGRVQTPTLALVVKRQHEIDNFVPKNYWELKTVYRDTLFSAANKGYPTEEKAQEALNLIKDKAFIITEVTKKKGKEAPPKLFDLTSLQVECDKVMGLSADETLKTIQSLYEKKVATYPRVDTTCLPEDVYPKCGSILNSLRHLFPLMDPIKGKKLLKRKKVFDNSKITDHHAIIPTGQQLPNNLSKTEKDVFDLIAKRFLAIFFPDCEFEQTIVRGSADKINFKANGKVIISKGWKSVFEKDNIIKEDESKSDEDKDKILPPFEKGESGPHYPKTVKKTTTPPKYYTEGTLLKAMETAGAQVDDEDLRESLKANGIGRPSTRAAIIEILYKRGYIRKERKSLRATEAGINLISIIHEELLKSPKLTGIWEGRLRMIERGQYSPQEFIDSLKKMISDITITVMKDNTNRRIHTEQKN